MNFLKKYVVFVVCCAVVLVLLILAGVKLVSSAKRFSGEKHDLRAAMSRLQQLYGRDPYPSAENVDKESKNVGDLLEVYSALNEMLRQGQVDPELMQAADFMPLLENTLRRMRNRFESARIAFPAEFAFGFEKYAGGQLPAPRDIPRLVQQLKIIEKLCEILPEANVIELVSISREEFETGPMPPTSAGRLRQRGAVSEAPGPGEESKADKKLYTTQTFKMVFRAREHASFDVLNRLARHPMFSVVTYVNMDNKNQDIRARSVPVRGTEQTTAPEPRDLRVILGKEELEVALEVEVYQFAPSMAFQ